MADDGLKWMLEIDAKTEGPSALLTKLDALDRTLKVINSNIAKFGDASMGAGRAHAQHGKEADKLGGIFDRLIHKGLDPFLHKAKEIAEFEFLREATEKLMELPGELAEKVFELGEEMLRTAAKAERTESSFKLLFGAKGGGEALEDIDKIGEHTEFTRERLKSLTQDLGKVGFEGMDLKRARAAALDIAAFSSNAAEGLASAEGALERVKRTGRVDNRTLGGLGIGEKDFFGELTKRTGKGRKELKKEMDAGTLDAQDSLEALYTVITKKTGKKLGGAGADLSLGMEATFTHLGELPDRYFEKLSKSAGFAKMGESLKHMLDELDPDSENGKRIFGKLEAAFNGIGEIIGAIDWAGFIGTATDALETFEEMFLEALSIIPGETGSKAGYALNNMKKRRHEREVNEEEGTKFAASAKSNNTTTAFEKAAAEQEDYNDLDEAENTGALLGTGMVKGMDGSKFDVGDAGAKLGQAAIKGARGPDGVDAHSPSRAFENIGKDTADGFYVGVQRNSDRMGDAMSSLLPTVAASGTSGGARTITMAPHITVNLHGSHGDKDAQDIAAAVAEILPSALQSAIDNLAIQAGAS